MISGLEGIKTRFKCDIEDTLISNVYAYLQSESLSELLDTDNYVDKVKEAKNLE